MIVTTTSLAPARHPRITTLATCLAAALAFTAPDAMAFNRVVLNCNDSGSGSLRDIVTNQAQDGDTVDLSQLSCSTITLTTGEIAVIVNNLTLTAGPGANSALTIDGGWSAGHHNRVLAHTGTGTLNLQGVTITDAKYNSGPAFEGGCIFSAGAVSLTASTVSNCSVFGAASDFNSVLGGGIYAAGNVQLLASEVSYNFASASGTNISRGGGIYSAHGNVVAVYSDVSHNTAAAAATQHATGGGIDAHANLTVSYSTISANRAQIGGGIFLKDATQTHAGTITNSTISGNDASDGFLSGGGMYVNVPLALSNSTIAFNTGASSVEAAGLTANSVQLQSSIIADNTSAGAPSDLYASTLAGSDNLIFESSASLASLTNTITGVCPKLARLAGNGAWPQTHALYPTSPAIDKGNNALALTADERGDPYHRTVGVAPDMGAFERQGVPIDALFRSGFEPGCDE